MKRKIILTVLTIAVVIVLFLNIYTLPYYVSKPGMAKELDGVIAVDGGTEAEGKFMLTTVWMGKANLLTYYMAENNKYHKIYDLEDIRYEDETDEEYTVRQLYMMEESQENALQVAFKEAGKEVSTEYLGIYVLSVLKDSPADHILRAGDRITKIDQSSFESSKGFTDYIQNKQAGDQVTITFIRDGKEEEATITLKVVEAIGKPGIGISLVEDKEVYTDPAVEIDTDEIGGPSAGLMFTLEIYNQLVEEDITKGYLIAGTGTMSTDGTVGPIGGIDQKIVAADKSGAEIFFAPNENGKEGSDYQVAVQTAKDIGTDMQIVPVDTFDDAVKFLESLETKG